MKKYFCSYCGHREEVSDKIVFILCPFCSEEMKKEGEDGRKECHSA